MSRIRKLFTFANVTAVMALVVAMSGTSYALIITSKQIKNNSLTSVDIQDGAIKNVDLSGASVGSKQVIDNSLKLVDIHSEVENKHEETLIAQRTDSAGTISGSGFTNVGELGVPAGKYLAMASIQIEGGLTTDSQQGNPSYEVTCRMVDAGDGETVTRILDMHGEYHDNKELTLLMAHKNGGEGLIVDCIRSGSVSFVNEVIVGEVEFVAMPLDKLTVPLGLGGG